MFRVEYHDLGLIPYQEAWDYQEVLFRGVIGTKLHNETRSDEEKQEAVYYFLLCEHPHVFTLGRSGKESNLLIPAQILEAKHATFVRTNRGGDITYHGPGQIVGYPIFDLDALGFGIKEYIHRLEEVIIKTLESFGIVAGRLEGATGVWLDPEVPGKARKICAIGVRASRYVTMHGFALNVNTDLSYFDLINPCGFVDKGVTSIERESGEKVDMEKVKDVLKEKMERSFGLFFH